MKKLTKVRFAENMQKLAVNFGLKLDKEYMQMIYPRLSEDGVEDEEVQGAVDVMIKQQINMYAMPSYRAIKEAVEDYNAKFSNIHRRMKDIEFLMKCGMYVEEAVIKEWEEYKRKIDKQKKIA